MNQLLFYCNFSFNFAMFIVHINPVFIIQIFWVSKIFESHKYKMTKGHLLFCSDTEIVLYTVGILKL